MAESDATVSDDDRVKIVASAVDYIESWLDGDAARMARCLHPDLAKRSLEIDAATGSARVETLSRDDMVAATGRGRGTKLSRPYQVSILDAYRDIATVKVLSSAYMDYLHVIRLADRWLLLNVLWQRRPGR